MRARSGRIRLTPVGSGILVAGLAGIGLGLVSGYREFTLLGVAGLAALACAILVPRLGSSIRLERIDTPRFVPRGSTVPMTVRATTERVAPPSRILDQLNDTLVSVDLPAVSRKTPVDTQYFVYAQRRGVHTVGPILEERTDPFGLASRTVRHDVVAELLIHPAIHQLRLPDTAQRALQANAIVPRFSEDPLADFRSLRDYEVGDDPRRVHWPSSAKTGTLVVRDQFEIRRTNRVLLLETLSTAMTPVLFEEAVEIAASIACESLRQGMSITVLTRDGAHPGRSLPLRHRQQALDLFTRVQQTSSDDTIGLANLRLTRDPADRLIVIASSSSELTAQLGRNSRLRRQLTLVCVGNPPNLPGVQALAVNNAHHFAARWNAGLVPL